MLKQTDVKFGNTEYVIQQLPCTRGLEVGIHLVKIIMGAADGVGSIPEGKGFLEVDVSPTRMAAGIFGKIEERGTPQFIKALVQESLIRPDPGEGFDTWYENQFAANYEELYDLVAAIISHNGYVDLIKKKMGEVMEMFYSSDGEDAASTPSSKDPS